MKKRAIVVVSVLLVVVMAFAGCGAAAGGPSAMATKYLDSIKNGDIDAMAECLDPDTATMFKAAMEMMGEEAFNMGDLLGAAGVDAASISYKIVGEKIDGDTATVTVDTTATVDGEEKTESNEIPLTKIDGKWYISMGL
jgi:ketosteroid isomerase-like protein